MEIELGPFLKYENARHNAYWSRVAIDTRLKVDEDDMGCYKAHLQDCENHPTSGLLIKHKYITGKPMNYPAYASRNIRYMERQPEIDTLQKTINAKLNSLYPNTKHIRQYTIDNNRVLLDFVEPVKKYSVFEKILLMARRFV